MNLTGKQPVFIINDLETLKVMTDPLHLQIFELLNPEPQTVNQVAQKMGTSGSRLYYHFSLMESVGLVRVVETRQVNNIIEKVFWVTAEDIEIDRDLMNFSSKSGQDNIVRFMLSSLDATREDILRSLQARSKALEHGAPAHPRKMVVQKIKKQLKDETYNQFVEELKILLKTFDDLPDEDDGMEQTSVYTVACYLYPSFAFGGDNPIDKTEEYHA